MTPQQIYMRALDRMRSRIATMERDLNGASLSVHEEFEELCLIVDLLEQFTKSNQNHDRFAIQLSTKSVGEGTAQQAEHKSGAC